MVKQKLLTRYKTFDGIIHYFIEGGDYSKAFCEETIAKLLIKNYPQLNYSETLVDMTIIMWTVYTSGYMSTIYKSILTNGKMPFDPFHNYLGQVAANMDVGSYAYAARNKDLEMNKDALRPIFAPIFDGMSSDTSIKPNVLSIIIESPSSPSEAISRFIKEIYKYSKRSNDKIKIMYLTLDSEVKTTEVPNPEYSQWEQKKEMLEKIKADPKILAELYLPSKTITKETVEKKINIKQLNEIEKDIDTLYLRKQDMEVLISCLSQFRDKKDIIKGLGLPNKLNVLLYGRGGTGKSTTIQAVATYLRKDIYYVDLKQAETNADLQMIFEYVNKNVSNGGIVVLEDIDAMTTAVHKRELTPKGGTLDQKSKLTLDYFLNVLQGTLTLDDSIFMITTNHLEHLDPAFYRDGRFDIKIELKFCDHYQINAIYKRIMGREVPVELLKRISEDKFSPASLIFHVKNYIFVPSTLDEVILAPYLE